jgi:hypothetical protein
LGDRRGAYRISVRGWGPDGKRLIGRPVHRWENNFKMNFQDMG